MLADPKIVFVFSVNIFNVETRPQRISLYDLHNWGCFILICVLGFDFLFLLRCRILANREAAARSKEKKTRYTTEMQRKLDTLQTHATTLSAQLTLLQGNTSCLSAENKELKLRLESLEQQAKLRKALKEALMSENNRLKMEKAKQVGKNRFSDTRLLPQLPPRVAKYGGNLNPQQQCQMPNQNQNRPRNA
ncbi:hypothetical protein RND81_01G161200 [Saponaria officinalis]|uniref:BZIP domain-containing protein n=1 Tax=Saponaria officinalis TaxID=3572 RepID=A0AAW1NJ42_SAPOF